MKVLLVPPTFHYPQEPPLLLSLSDFPAGFAYIAAALKEAGHEVFGLNPNNAIGSEKNYYLLVNQLFAALQEIKPDLIGLGGICIDFAFLKDAVELIRKFAPRTPIVLGGGIITNDREFIFGLLKPDFGIVGEGEETIVQLAKALEAGQREFKEIDNLSYWADGRAIFNPFKPLESYGDVDKRPLPDYEPFGIRDMIDNYSMATRLLFRYSRTYPRPMTIVTARGCPFNCSFCIHRGNQFYRPRSIKNVMEEIRVNYERYRFNILIILDELFAVNKQRMRDFCEGVLEGKRLFGWDFDWQFQTHASARLDYDTLLLAKQAGCVYFSYGIESASPKVLKSMNKKTDVSQITEAVRLADSVGIGFGGNLIFGDPAETQLTIYESLDFFAKYGVSAFIFLSFLRPYPGNRLFDYCSEKGIIRDKGEYYANIDQAAINMTSLPDSIWYQWTNFFSILERSWLWVKDTDAISIDKEEQADPVASYRGASMFKVQAQCPYCKQAIMFREMIANNKTEWPLFMGVGCPKCNKRIKINLKLPVENKEQAEEKVAVLV